MRLSIDYEIRPPLLVFMHFLRLFEANPAFYIALVDAETEEEEDALYELTEEEDLILDLRSVGTGHETRSRLLAMTFDKMASDVFAKVANAAMLEWKNTPDFEVPGYGKIEFTFRTNVRHIRSIYLNKYILCNSLC